MIWISFESIGIIFIVVVLLAISGVSLIVEHLYDIALVLSILMAIVFLIYEIANVIDKKRPIYILNSILGAAFFIFGFELLYETISLVEGSVNLLKTMIFYGILCGVLIVIIRVSHRCEKKSQYRILSIVHSILVIVILGGILSVGVNQYFHDRVKSISLDENAKVVVLQDSEIYLMANLSAGRTFSYVWYPLDLRVSFGTFEKGTQVYMGEDEFGECYEVTDGKRIGYVNKKNISN